MGKNKLILKISIIPFIIILVIFILSYFLKNKLPNPSQIDNLLFKEPIQSDLDGIEAIIKEEKGVKYQIQPLYNYELWGLVVSQNDNEVWYSRFKKIDPLNTKDFCVIWGENLKNNNYQNIKFKTEEFVCLYSYSREIQFNQNQLSNNHLLYPDDELYKKIRQAHIGDQIHLKGYLVSYKVINKDSEEMTRGTSSTRLDTGQGACETIYVNYFEILKTNGVLVKIVYLISKYLIILSLLAIIILALYNFFKPEKMIKKKIGFIERNKKYKDSLPPSVGGKI